jgi:ATP-dependent Lon protease
MPRNKASTAKPDGTTLETQPDAAPPEGAVGPKDVVRLNAVLKQKAAAAAPAKDVDMINDPYEWVAKQTPYATSADVQVPTKLIDQVIGQELAVAVAEKASSQRRHLLLIGDPGTGKSMIAKAMSEMLPAERLNDVLTYHNAKDPNNPRMLTVDAGAGKKVVHTMKKRARRRKVVNRTMEWVLIIGFIGMGLYYYLQKEDFQVLLFSVLISVFLLMFFRGRKDPVMFAVPKLLMSHEPGKETHAPYVDGTGSHAGALLGDVRHDPYQSGGLETPPHDRVEVGAIHRAHRGVLFIDEINVLRLESQQSLLTALQERVYAIVGQSQTSSGAMVRTEPVPCDFILVAAGNLDAVQPPDGRATGMHPALRSRIRGYGYEVYVNNRMNDDHENRLKLVRFVAQEVARDGRIPHFERDAIAEVILEAQRRSGERGKLTLRLRELGGLVRTAGDIAAGAQRALVTADDVRKAKLLSRSLEQQIADNELDSRRTHESLRPVGQLVGVAAGAGLVGTGEVGEPAGLVVPVAAAVSPPLSRSEGRLAFGGGLEDSARGQTETVGALLKTLVGQDIASKDVSVHSVVRQTGVDSEGCGAAMAVAAISAVEGIPVRQDTVIIGGLTVNGELRAVRGITQQIESAIDAGYTRAICPETNRRDVLLNPIYRGRVTVEFAHTLTDVLTQVLASVERKELMARITRLKGLATSTGRNGHNGHHKPEAGLRPKAGTK